MFPVALHVPLLISLVGATCPDFLHPPSSGGAAFFILRVIAAITSVVGSWFQATFGT